MTTAVEVEGESRARDFHPRRSVREVELRRCAYDGGVAAYSFALCCTVLTTVMRVHGWMAGELGLCSAAHHTETSLVRSSTHENDATPHAIRR
jgi:hypothetical protein